MDARQFPQWGKYLSQIGWKVEKIPGGQIFIRPIPFLGCSIIKIQRLPNPILFAKIDQLAKKYHALTAIIEPDLKGFEEKVFLKNGFQKSVNMSLSETATMKINLKLSSAKLWASISENARRNIKKAQVNNLTVKKVYLAKSKDETDFKIFFDLLKNLSQDKKFFIPGFGEFQKKMLAFKENSLLLFAFEKEKPVASVWLGYYQDTAVYMHVGINQRGYELLANYLLVWEAFGEAQKRGCSEFDFEGLYDPRFPNLRKKWVNFSEFKKRFHGQLIEYPPPYLKNYNIIFKFIYLCNTIFSR